MMPVPIAAAHGFTQVAPEIRDSLRDRLKAACPQAPRRLNRLTELALIGAHGCVRDRPLPADTGIFIAFTSGAVADSAALVRNVVRGRPLMPVDFINVSSNMTGFHVAGSLGLLSSNQVVASHDFPWESAIELALLGGRRRALIGAVEECAWPLDEHRDRLGLAPDRRLLETSQWLWIDRDAASPVAMLHGIQRFEDDAALTRFLGAHASPADGHLLVANAEAAPFARHTGLRLLEGLLPDGHTGMPGAAACVRFIEQGAGSLLSLHRGSTGQWCVVEFRRAS